MTPPPDVAPHGPLAATAGTGLMTADHQTTSPAGAASIGIRRTA